MAVDLADLVDSVKREVNPPGTNLFPASVDDDWIGQLRDSFWEARLFGMLAGYTEADGLVRNTTTGGAELPREEQQLIVLFAGIRVVRMAMINTNTAFRARAGTVEFETQNSANLLQEIMKQLQHKVDIIYAALSKLGRITDTYIDSLAERDFALLGHETSWWGSSGRDTGYRGW